MTDVFEGNPDQRETHDVLADLTINIPSHVERIDYNEDGTVDDVAISVGGGMFRLEQMDTGQYWLTVYMPDGSGRHTFWLSTKRPGKTPIEASYMWEALR